MDSNGRIELKDQIPNHGIVKVSAKNGKSKTVDTYLEKPGTSDFGPENFRKIIGNIGAIL